MMLPSWRHEDCGLTDARQQEREEGGDVVRENKHMMYEGQDAGYMKALGNWQQDDEMRRRREEAGRGPGSEKSPKEHLRDGLKSGGDVLVDRVLDEFWWQLSFLSLSLSCNVQALTRTGCFLFLNGLLQERKTSQRNVPPHIAPSLCKNFNVAMVSSSPSGPQLPSSPLVSSILLSAPLPSSPLLFPILSFPICSSRLCSALLSPSPESDSSVETTSLSHVGVHTHFTGILSLQSLLSYWTTAGFSLSLVTCGPQACSVLLL